MVQLFKIYRAPERPKLTAKQLEQALWKARPDSEWRVAEVMPINGHLVDVRVADVVRKKGGER